MLKQKSKCVMTFVLLAVCLASMARPAGAALDDGSPTALELAMPEMTRLARDVWVGQVAKGLWVHTTTRRLPDGTVYPANGMLMETRRGALLFDTGWTEAQTETLLEWARRKLKKPISRAFITHAHEDRLGGMAALARRGVPVFALALTREIAGRQGNATLPRAVEGLERQVWRDAEGFELFYPGAGHSRDNIVVYFQRRGVLFGGCLVKSVTAPNLGNTADASLADWPLTVERVRRAYPSARTVVPGHGTISGDPLGRTLELLEKNGGSSGVRVSWGYSTVKR